MAMADVRRVACWKYGDLARDGDGRYATRGASAKQVACMGVWVDVCLCVRATACGFGLDMKGHMVKSKRD